VAKTPRTWTGARTPSGLKRVRQAQSRHEVLQPRRSAAKTYVARALAAVAQPEGSSIDPVAALAEALSALDRAAKVGAIHPNAAARRKSRLTIKVNAALGGTTLQTGRVVKATGKAAAAKAAKVRIAAGKAGKAKGAQTAAGKARAALSKTARAEAAAAKAAAESLTTSAAPVKATAARTTKAAAAKKPAATNKVAATKKPAAKATAARTTAKAAPKAAAAKKTAPKG
jgi:ribosomal protein S20